MFPQANHQSKRAIISLAISLVVIMCLISAIQCAPSTSSPTTPSTSSSKSTASNRPNLLLRNGLFSNLFRRQTSSANSSNNENKENTIGNNNDSDSNEITPSSPDGDGMTPTEIEAQKFMDNLPNPNGSSNNSGPTSFRERVSESFGVLRDGVSNQFRSLRENWSDTVEDLRDTWSSSAQD